MTQRCWSPKRVVTKIITNLAALHFHKKLSIKITNKKREAFNQSNLYEEIIFSNANSQISFLYLFNVLPLTCNNNNSNKNNVNTTTTTTIT